MIRLLLLCLKYFNWQVVLYFSDKDANIWGKCMHMRHSICIYFNICISVFFFFFLFCLLTPCSLNLLHSCVPPHRISVHASTACNTLFFFFFLNFFLRWVLSCMFSVILLTVGMWWINKVRGSVFTLHGKVNGFYLSSSCLAQLKHLLSSWKKAGVSLM